MPVTTVAPGTRLGPYKIESMIGAGGMGEVYRAKDERLDRAVAVKVLPPALAADTDRLRRFEHEARAAGQLNHPNILAIHDVGSSEGLSYLVTELLEGHTVREILADGPIPPRKAVEIAIQVATGLSAAHGKAIAHRDLKPENVFVDRAGHVKILDFGLAKLVRPADDASSGHGAGGAEKTAPLVEETNALANLTMTGTILGTASYMSPEQIRMLPTDHRTDIFSLGCILHEMLAGRRAFDGETPADRMSAILHSDPPPVPRGVEGAIPGIGTVIRRCLEKRADDRFESARELAFALRLVTERIGASPVAPEEAATAGTSATPTPSFAATLKRVAYREGYVRSARFAPDGQTVCYTAAWEGKPMELFWALSGNPESRAVGFTDTEIFSIAPNGEMAVSLKRRHLGGFIYTGMLARMPLGGGAPRQIQDGIFEACWGPDGRQLAVTRESMGMLRLEYPMGKLLYETSGWPSHIRVSPDGKSVAFLDHGVRGNDAGSVAMVDTQGNFRTLAAGWLSCQGLAWSPDGREVWFTAYRAEAARSLLAVGLDGRLRPIFQAPGPMILQDIAKNGDVLIVHGSERMRMQYLGPGESRLKDLSWLDWSLIRDVSADGKTLLFDESGVGGGELHSVYMRGVDGSPAIRLGDGVNPRLSPDGQWAMCGLDDATFRVILLPTGAGQTRVLPTGKLQSHGWCWFPDGNRVCVAAHEGSDGLRLYELDIESGAYRAFSEEGVNPNDVIVTPDGKWGTTRDHNGRFTLFPVEGGEPRYIDAVNPQDRAFGFSEDGSAILVFTRGIIPAQVFRVDLATGERTHLREISPSDPTGVDGITYMQVTRDGSAVAYSYPQGLGDLYVIQGLK